MLNHFKKKETYDSGIPKACYQQTLRTHDSSTHRTFFQYLYDKVYILSTEIFVLILVALIRFK